MTCNDDGKDGGGRGEGEGDGDKYTDDGFWGYSSERLRGKCPFSPFCSLLDLKCA